MDDKRKYDPEDIESLMMHKTFEELYPEEKTFILEHLDSSDEYESMRKTLLTVMAASNDHDRIVADPAIKESLLAEFGTQKRGGFTIWLNSTLAWLAPPKIEWYRKPAFQMAFASIALLVGFFVFSPAEEVRFADAAKPGEETTTNEAPVKSENEIKAITTTEDEVPEGLLAEEPAEGALENVEGVDNLIFTPEENHFAATDNSVTDFNGNNESILEWDLADGDVEAEDLAIAKVEINEVLELDADRIEEEVRERKEVTESVTEDFAFNKVEEELDKVDDVIVTTEKTSTRAATPAMVDDVALEMSEIRDDAVGNMIGEIENVTLSSVEVAADAGIATGSNADFEGEALFSKKTAGVPVQASTRKYKDLIDLLYTAM